MRVSPFISLPLALFLSLQAPLQALADGRTATQAASDANRLLAEGAYSDAARAYSEAIELDPTSYVNYYKRATAYLSLGRHGAALEDFDAILRLNPGFSQARLQKAKILAKEGDFDQAHSELKLYGKSKSEDAEAVELDHAVTTASAAMTLARKAFDARSWNTCVEQASRALEVGPHSTSLRELRVSCATELGDVDSVYGDLSRLATLNPSTLSLPLKLSNIAYFVLHSASATTHVKQCLHYDPDSKPCKVVHKLLRSLERDTSKARNLVEGGSFRQAIKLLSGEDGLLERFETALDDAISSGYVALQFRPVQKSQSRLELYSLACRAAVGANDLGVKTGMAWCEETLALDPNNADALVGRGERLLKEENWEEAVRVLERAFEHTGRSSQDVLNRLQRAQRLLKVSKQKDYYKVLDVPRDADERAIKKAFRKAAKVNHPDVGGTEQKMAALNEAYEVLSDPELRQRYDNGDDPNDPAGGQRGNPFAHHGGAPFQFFQQGGFPGGGGFPHGQKMHFQWGG